MEDWKIGRMTAYRQTEKENTSKRVGELLHYSCFPSFQQKL